MKRITPLLLMAGMIAPSGCISTYLVENKAQPHLKYSVDEQQNREAEGEPIYYALLPLTIAGDVATAPFQIGYFLWTDGSHSGSASIHGFPIPLP